MNPEIPQVLAFERFGATIGKNLYAEDLQTEQQVEGAFNLSQIQCLYITGEGWQHLFQRFGIAKLYEIDQLSEWFFDENEIEGDWLECIYALVVMCGYYPGTNSLGTWNDDENSFVTSGTAITIDWQHLRALSIKEAADALVHYRKN